MRVLVQANATTFHDLQLLQTVARNLLCPNIKPAAPDAMPSFEHLEPYFDIKADLSFWSALHRRDEVPYLKLRPLHRALEARIAANSIIMYLALRLTHETVATSIQQARGWVLENPVKINPDYHDRVWNAVCLSEDFTEKEAALVKALITA